MTPTEQIAGLEQDPKNWKLEAQRFREKWLAEKQAKDEQFGKMAALASANYDLRELNRRHRLTQYAGHASDL